MKQEEKDPLLRRAIEICIKFKLGSTSMLQRHLLIGYYRASRLINQMEELGVIGPHKGLHSRELLIQSIDQVENKLTS